MARIYLSSTYLDLQDYRYEILRLLRNLKYDLTAMENYGATDERPVDKCLADVASCDIYIGLIAWRYGHIPAGYDQSITELEYRHAKKHGKRCYLFLMSDEVPLAPKYVEAKERVEQLRNELLQNHTVGIFSSKEDLIQKLIQTMDAWKLDTPEIKANIQSWLTYEVHYRNAVRQRFATISAPYFNTDTRKLPIDAVYVEPNFSTTKSRSGVSYKNFIRDINKTVILGHPGSGKSTLCAKVCYELATHYEEGLIAGRLLTPIPILLREYAIQRKNKHHSFPDFITLTAKSMTQSQPPTGVFEYLLQEGRVAVIFDGLDELLETSDRQLITQDIEIFHQQYSQVPILITSRVVGYRQAPLDSDKFTVYQMSEFDDTQIERYVHQWFKLEQPEYEIYTQNFLEELRSISREIRTNPLMLSLLCNIYRGESYIPRNKPEIYERCTQLLFERRDKERHLVVELPLQSQLYAFLAHLADWIYGDTGWEGGVTEKKLIERIGTYITGRYVDDVDEAKAMAEKIVHHCVGRAWVFTDTGTTKEGERLYQFTHRTFLEYFKAKYLVRTIATVKELVATLYPRLIAREWEVVTQLAVQQKGQATEEAASEIITLLLDYVNQAEEVERLHLLTFMFECLAFITPPPNLIRLLTKKALQYGIEATIPHLKEIVDKAGYEGLYESHHLPDHTYFLNRMIYLITQATDENRKLIYDVLKEQLGHYIQDENEYVCLVASELTLNLRIGARSFDHRRKSTRYQRLVVELDKITEAILQLYAPVMLERLGPKYVLTCVDLFYLNHLSLTQLVAWHGIESLFQQYYYPVLSGLYSGEIVPFLLSDFQNENDTDKLLEAQYIERFADIGSVLLSVPTPWITLEEDSTWMIGGRSKSLERFNSRALFGVFIALAFLYERWVEVTHQSSGINDLDLPFSDYFKWSFLARRGNHEVNTLKIEAEIKRCREWGKDSSCYT